MKIVVRYGFIVSKQSPERSRFTVIKYRKKIDLKELRSIILHCKQTQIRGTKIHNNHIVNKRPTVEHRYPQWFHCKQTTTQGLRSTMIML